MDKKKATAAGVGAALLAAASLVTFGLIKKNKNKNKEKEVKEKKEK